MEETKTSELTAVQLLVYGEKGWQHGCVHLLPDLLLGVTGLA